jgi:AcrR family transcriptional regulator
VNDTLTRGERTRKAILDASERLFLTRGYHGTSMRQIAHEAGDIAVGGIYNHFDGKEGIFQALLSARSPYPAITAALEEMGAESGPDMLSEAFSRLQAIIKDNLPFFGLVLIDVQEFEGRTIRELIDQMVPTVFGYWEKLQAAGGLRDDVDRFVMIRIFVSVLIGYALTNLIAFSRDGKLMLSAVPDTEYVAWEEAIMDVLLHGIANPIEADS